LLQQEMLMDWINRLRQEGDYTTKLATDLEFFAAEGLKIRPKAGSLAPFIFNPAQRELHRIIEEQKAKTGRVRVVVLKARQMGISTYVAARYYKITTSNPGLRCSIIAHEKAASRNLFNLVKRYHDNMPAETRQSTGTSNAEELVFDKIDSGYLVSVATQEGAGRSSTAQLLHASEAAFWVDLQEQLAGLLQTVPDGAGSEVIIESTGNQFGDEFHQFWRRVVAGESEFKAIFLPWSIDPTYRAPLSEDFEMTGEEKALSELHGLDKQQIAWRRNKISQLGNERYFAREYPLTPDEAFLATDFDSFISSESVLRARKAEIEPYGPLIVGIDPAGKGADSTAIAWRRGRVIEKIEKRRGLSTMEICGLVAKIIREEKPEKVNVDATGMGIGIYDRLVEQGYSECAAINFAGKPIEPAPLDESGKPAGGPANRRAELWLNLQKALEGRLKIPDSDSLHADLTSVGYRYDSSGRLLLESKEDMRRRGMPSPDEADAVALTFAQPLGAPSGRGNNFWRQIEYQGQGYV
jgi:hypothetical protein